ncbi:Protein of unknown function [Gryllus bimaculatus]|nr:Protein of unknown function [Gryllus bimaculatus]
MYGIVCCRETEQNNRHSFGLLPLVDQMIHVYDKPLRGWRRRWRWLSRRRGGAGLEDSARLSARLRSYAASRRANPANEVHGPSSRLPGGGQRAAPTQG